MSQTATERTPASCSRSRASSSTRSSPNAARDLLGAADHASRRRHADRGGAAAPRRRSRARGRDGRDRRPRARHGRGRHRRRRSRCRSARSRSAASGTCSASRSTRSARRRPAPSAGRSTATRPTSPIWSPKVEIFETGIKVDRPDRAVRARRQDRPLRRRRRRQDGADPGADPQHRARARRRLGVLRRRRAHPRGQRPLLEMERVGACIDKVALCFGQMNEPPGARLRVGLSGLTMAEYFRDQGQDVLLFIDNIFRFVAGGLRGLRAARAHAERRRLPADARHRDGPAAGAHHVHHEGLGHLGAGDLRARRRPDRPGAGATTFAHLDATTVLSRALVEQGIYPAVDPLDSTSRMLEPGIVGEEHYRSRTRRAGDPAALQGPAGHHRDPRHRGALRRGQADRLACAQDPALPLAAVLRRRGSSPARPASTSRSRTRSAASREILDGKHDDLPEQAFYMVGTIEGAVERGEADGWRTGLTMAEQRPQVRASASSRPTARPTKARREMIIVPGQPARSACSLATRR